MIENPAEEVNSSEPILTKEERIEKEREILLSRMITGRIENIKDRVAYILNNFTDARNSDIDLAWYYWSNFESDKFNGHCITRDDMIILTRLSSLSRTRATIQNEYKLFQADEEVQQFRGVLQEDQKRDAIENKPTGLSTYTVFLDESGKTQDYLMVGSLWIFSAGQNYLIANDKINKWKDSQNIGFEFHFKDLSSSRLSLYKEFFSLVLASFPDAGFKFILVKNSGISDMNLAITDLTFHLLHKGILHEHESGRAPLPRNLSVWLDEDERGSDKIKTENLKERITGQKIDGLYLSQVVAVASHDSFFIQAIDLFLGAVNRKLNTPNGNNVKDEFASFVFEVLNFDERSINTHNSDADNATVFNLRQK